MVTGSWTEISLFGFFLVIIPYFVGAIPTGYIFAKLFFGLDITKHGSGNIGATNSARVLGGVHYFFLIFFLDAGKAALYLYILPYLIPGCSCMSILAAVMLLIGNGYSCFLQGKGGKGVATLVGIIALLAPMLFFVVLLAVWILLFAYFRKVDAASLLTLFVSLFIYRVFFYVQAPECMYFLLFAFGWLIVRHQTNIQTWISKKKC